MPKVNYSAYQAVEALRWTSLHMTANAIGLTYLTIGDLKIADARSGIILEGLKIGTTGSAHVNLTLSDGIEYLHLSIFDKANTKVDKKNVTKAAIYYQITEWPTAPNTIKLSRVDKCPIDGTLVNIKGKAYHTRESDLKRDLQIILATLFVGCKDTS